MATLRTKLRSAAREQDAMRLDDLSQRHGLPFRKTGMIYRFEGEEFTAYGLDQALAFAEGYDRAIDRREDAARNLDAYALEIAYQALAECDITDCQSCHDAARKTITTYLSVLEQQVRRGAKRKVLEPT
jgi:hypothetical protein